MWRVTHIVSAEDGPGEVFVRLRKLVGRGFWGDLLDCFYCLSLWIAVPFACWLGDGWKEKLLLWPALSAAGILLERLSSPRLEEARGKEEDPALYFEASEHEGEDHPDVVLRKEERRFADDGRPGFAPKVVFEYTGNTAMAVIGAVSRMRYTFIKPGARVQVDARDRASLAAVPHLRQA